MAFEETYGIDVHEEAAQHTSEAEQHEQNDFAQLEQDKNNELNELNRETTDKLAGLVHSLSNPEKKIEHNDTAGAYGFENLQHPNVPVEA